MQNDLKLTRLLNRVMLDAVTDKRIVGSVVMVAKNGNIIYQHAAGYANREKQIPMTEDAIFLLSSVTKLVVTVAALQLIEEGKLKFTDVVSHYLPDFRPKLADGSSPEITIYQLLTHTSGLSYNFHEAHGQGIYHQLGISDGFDNINITLAENLQRLAKAPLLFEPGSQWNYSLSIDVLGAVLEIICKQTLPELIHDRITQPLGMKNTGFTVIDKQKLVAHYRDAQPEPIPMGDFCDMQLSDEMNSCILSFAPARIFDLKAYPSGGAGMAGTAPELMQFMLALIGGDLISKEVASLMWQPHVSIAAQTQGPGWGFGYGGAVLGDAALSASPQSVGTLQWGGVYGHSWFYDPVEDLAVIALTNTGLEGLFGSYPQQICDAIYAGIKI